MIELRKIILTTILVLLMFLALSGSSALAITRSEVIARAKSWVSTGVPYSQIRTFRGYRADCSGFVSYAWNLYPKPGHVTWTLPSRSYRISKSELKPGDIMLNTRKHVVLFAGWADSARTKYYAYEQRGGQGSIFWVVPYPYIGGDPSYHPRRFYDIVDDPLVNKALSLFKKSFDGYINGLSEVPQRVKKTFAKSEVNEDGLSEVSFLYGGPDGSTQWNFFSSGVGFKPIKVWQGKRGVFQISRAKMAMIDLNGDYIADTAYLYRNPDHTTSLWHFYSKNSHVSKTVKVWQSKPNAFEWSRSKIAAGDFNGDGLGDIAAFYKKSNARSLIWIFFTGRDGKVYPVKWWDSASDEFDWGRAKMTSGDYNGDGRTDLVFLYDYPSSKESAIWVFISKRSGGFYTYKWWSSNGSFETNRAKIVSGYFNDDNDADIAAFYKNPDGRSSVIVFYSNGEYAFAPKTLWSSQVRGFEWKKAKVMAGDYNGDTISDLAFLYEYPDGHTSLWTFINDATLFKPKIWWSSTRNGFKSKLAMPTG